MVVAQQVKTPLHLRLTTEDWLESFNQMTRAELGVLFYIRTSDPYGDRDLDIDCAALGKALGIHRTSVSRALEELSRKRLIDLEIQKARVRQKVSNKKLTLLTNQENQSNAEHNKDLERCASMHTVEHGRTTNCMDAQLIASAHTVEHGRTDDIYIDHARDQTNTDLKKTLSKKSENQKRKTVCTLEKSEETKLQPSATLTTEPETQQTNLTISSRNGLAVMRRHEPFYNRRIDPKDIQWDWIPEGPWKTEQGKLDTPFQTAIAQRWIKEHGGDLHEKKANVLKHFKNDPANLPIEWEWYQSVTLHKAANIQTRRLAGADTTTDEQEILNHGRAFAQLPQEMRVTEEQTPSQILQQVAPHILPAIAQDCQQVVLEPPKDKYGTINPAAYQPCITAEDTAYWQNVHARHASTENSDTGNTEQPPTAIDDGLSKAKALIESLTRKRERTKSLTSIADVFSPQEPYAATLEDMRKYLTSGSDTCRQIALDWASDPKNGCELVKVNGRVVDIREMEF